MEGMRGEGGSNSMRFNKPPPSPLLLIISALPRDWDLKHSPLVYGERVTIMPVL